MTWFYCPIWRKKTISGSIEHRYNLIFEISKKGSFHLNSNYTWLSITWSLNNQWKLTMSMDIILCSFWCKITKSEHLILTIYWRKWGKYKKEAWTLSWNHIRELRIRQRGNRKYRSAQSTESKNSKIFAKMWSQSLKVDR